MQFFVKMLLRLLCSFVPVDDEDAPRIMGKAKDWALSIRIDDDPDNKTPQHWRTIAKFLDNWAVQLGILFAYLFAYDEMQRMFREDKKETEEKI